MNNILRIAFSLNHEVALKTNKVFCNKTSISSFRVPYDSFKMWLDFIYDIFVCSELVGTFVSKVNGFGFDRISYEPDQSCIGAAIIPKEFSKVKSGQNFIGVEFFKDLRLVILNKVSDVSFLHVLRC